MFSTTDSRGRARLVACVPGWSCELVNDEQIETYGLSDHLHVIKPGSQDALFADLFGAYENEEPWLGYMWGTGDPAIKLDLVLLEEAAYSKECWETDKACHFDDSLVLVAVHKSLLPRAPEVDRFPTAVGLYSAYTQERLSLDGRPGKRHTRGCLLYGG